MKKRPTKLVNLKLEELSFVDSPANKNARVTIFKRADEQQSGEPIVDPSGTFELIKSSSTSTESEEAMTIQKAEEKLDALVRKRRERHEDESQAVAMTRVLETPEGKAAYREMTYAKDIQIAKGSTLLTYENFIDKVGDHSTDERAAAVDAWGTLDRMAKEHSSKTGLPFHKAYSAVLNTAKGKQLYAAGLAPSAGAAT
jgi:hypothetical protein